MENKEVNKKNSLYSKIFFGFLSILISCFISLLFYKVISHNYILKYEKNIAIILLGLLIFPIYKLLVNRVRGFNIFWLTIVNTLFDLMAHIDNDFEYLIAKEELNKEENIRYINVILNSKLIFTSIHLGIIIFVIFILLMIELENSDINIGFMSLLMISISFVLSVIIPSVILFLYTKLSFVLSKKDKIIILGMILFLVLFYLSLFVFKVPLEIIVFVLCILFLLWFISWLIYYCKNRY